MCLSRNWLIKNIYFSLFICLTYFAEYSSWMQSLEWKSSRVNKHSWAHSPTYGHWCKMAAQLADRWTKLCFAVALILTIDLGAALEPNSGSNNSIGIASDLPARCPSSPPCMCYSEGNRKHFVCSHGVSSMPTDIDPSTQVRFAKKMFYFFWVHFVSIRCWTFLLQKEVPTSSSWEECSCLSPNWKQCTSHAARCQPLEITRSAPSVHTKVMSANKPSKSSTSATTIFDTWPRRISIVLKAWTNWIWVTMRWTIYLRRHLDPCTTCVCWWWPTTN